MTTYLRVNWYHSLLFEPIVFYWELDAARTVRRAVEIFIDDSMRTGTEGQPNTSLLEGVIPDVADINKNEQFFAQEIAKADFDTIWEKATSPAATADNDT